MLDFLRAKLPVVERIQAQSNKFSTWGRYRILEKEDLTDYQRWSPVGRSRVGMLSQKGFKIKVLGIGISSIEAKSVCS